MYTVLIGDIHGNDTPLYYPNDKDYVIFDTNLNLQVGICGEFTFKVPAGNPKYPDIEQFKIITICDDGKEVWRGFIKEINESFDMCVEVYCLEDLAWMQTEYVAPVQETADRATKLQAVISAYNALSGVQGTVKTFEYGYVTITGNGKFETNYETTMLEALRGLAGDSQYVRVRRVYTNGVLHRYIDFVSLAYFGKTATQAIQFGDNLLDFVKELNTSWMVNVVYPYGDEIEGSEVYEGCTRRLAGTAVSDSTSISKYGRIAKNIIFGTSNSATLQTMAETYLNQNKDPRLSLELSAVDLSHAGYNTDSLELGDKVRVVADPFDIDQYVYITELDIDLQDLAKNTIRLSSTVSRRSSLTEMTAILSDTLEKIPSRSSILASAKENAIALLNGSDGGYVNLVFDSNNRVTELWITDSIDPSLATKKWVWNKNGLGYLYKENGSWHTNVAMTIDGQIVADRVATGMLTDAVGNNFWNLETGEFSLSATTEIGDGDTTLGDLADKSETIADVDVEYAKNQSSTTAPVSGWATTSPQWETGYYIWQRTKTTNGNNQVSYSTPVCIQGAKGEAGSSVTVSSIQYQQGNSATTVPSGSWSNTPVVVAQGKYLWTKTEYSNGSTAYTVAYQGNNGTNGQDGQDGRDGKGVSSTSITYGTSNSASTEPSSWSSSAPTTLAKGTWLWVKTVITYTDNTSSTSYTKSYIGTDGDDGSSIYVVSATKTGKRTTVVFSDGSSMVIDDGTDGTNGSPGLNGYVHTAWATTVQGMDGASSTTDFSTSVSEGKKYLGTYTDNTAADSSSWNAYSWSLIKGADGQDGQDGDDGIGVSAIIEQYYLSTSSSTCTGGSWSTTCPAWVSGKYIWTRSQVTWTDNSVTTTAPILAQAENQANEAVVALNTALNQQEIFKRLTNNQANQGIYLYNGNLYINASMIATGTMLADYIKGGTYDIGGVNNSSGVLKLWGNNNTSTGSASASAGSTGSYAYMVTFAWSKDLEVEVLNLVVSNVSNTSLFSGVEYVLRYSTDDWSTYTIEQTGQLSIGTNELHLKFTASTSKKYRLSARKYINTEADKALTFDLTINYIVVAFTLDNTGFNFNNKFIVERSGNVTAAGDLTASNINVTGGTVAGLSVENAEKGLSFNGDISGTDYYFKISAYGGLTIGTLVNNAWWNRLDYVQSYGMLKIDYGNTNSDYRGLIVTNIGNNSYHDAGQNYVRVRHNHVERHRYINNAYETTYVIWTGVEESSDRRMKDIVTELTDEICRTMFGIINPVVYQFKPEFKIEGTFIGAIAQDIEEALEEAEIEDTRIVYENDKGYKALDYYQLISLNSAGVKHLYEIVDRQQAEIDELKQLVNTLLNKEE